MAQENIIELRNISKCFEDTVALDNISLEIKNGEFLTLLGPSGCGKTTILRLVSGFETPDSGELLLNGECINDVPSEERQVNTVFQNYALFPHMNVKKNVGFGLEIRKTPAEECARRVREALRIVHLENFADRKPSQLSGGQQQRVAIARAIVNNPLVLLLDEPFSALDFKLRKAMQIEIKHLQRQLGITFVFVTHDQAEAFAMSDRVVVMNDGRIEQIGTPQEIYEEPANLYVARFVGDINILPGEIISRTSNVLYDARIAGLPFPVQTKRQFNDGDKVNVLLRPEDVRLHRVSDPIEGAHFMGVIQESVYKGATVDISVRLDAHPDMPNAAARTLLVEEFFNEDDEDITYTPGERVAVTWVNGWEVVLPDEGE